MMKTIRISLITCLALLLIASSLPAQTKTLTPEMVVSLRSASSVAISADGELIAYVLRVPRTAEEPPGGAYLEIWLVSREGGEPRPFTSKPVNSWSPAFSPDGKTLTFLSKRTAFDKHTQVYVAPVDGGEARPLTKSETDIRSFKWSPDGKWIAYIAMDPKSKEQREAEKQGRDWEVIDRYDRYPRLWAVEVASGEAHVVSEGALAAWDFAWSPDSRTLLLQASEEPNTDASYMFKRIYTVPLTGGQPSLLCQTAGKLGHMAWSPDGRQVAFLGAVDINDPASGSVFVVPATGGTPRNLTEGFQGTATWLEWVDTKTLAVAAQEGVQTTLSLLPATGGEMKRVLGGDVIFRSFELAGDGRTFALAGNTETHPSEVFLGSLKKKRLTRLTDSNPELDSVRFAAQEPIRWKAQDGLEIEGLLIKPLDYQAGRRYPLVVQIHGGPESAYLDGWNTSYSRWTQLLAARGYVVLMPNYRGSTGRGVEFAKGDHKDLGGQEFLDVVAGIEKLIADGLVDKSRVGLGGASYGGYFAALASTRYSEYFAASVVFAGTSNYLSKIGTTDTWHENALVHMAFYAYEDYDLTWRFTPLKYLDKANTPTLIAFGKNDLRVPASQGWELYRALKWKGVPVEFVLYPKEGHGLRQRAHQLDFLTRSLDWWDRYLKGEGTW
jgi:dipeptidyl aminopeptidase/acylaminoacyl peptidase